MDSRLSRGRGDEAPRRGTRHVGSGLVRGQVTGVFMEEKEIKKERILHGTTDGINDRRERDRRRFFAQKSIPKESLAEPSTLPSPKPSPRARDLVIRQYNKPMILSQTSIRFHEGRRGRGTRREESYCREERDLSGSAE